MSHDSMKAFAEWYAGRMTGDGFDPLDEELSAKVGGDFSLMQNILDDDDIGTLVAIRERIRQESISKAAPELAPDGSRISKHASHDQSTHGNWATSRVRAIARQSMEDTLKGRTYEERGALTESIRNEGIKEPLEITEYAPGKFDLTDGNQRLTIAESLGLETVPVTVSAWPISKHANHDQRDHGNWARGISSPQVMAGIRSGEYSDGFTLHIPNGGGPKKRYVVAKAGYETRIKGMDKVTVRDIRSYRRRNETELKKDATYLGGWVEDDELWLDVSLDFDNYDVALAFAQTNKQVSFWDNEEMRVIFLDES